jgi:nicotinamidase-related amidase
LASTATPLTPAADTAKHASEAVLRLHLRTRVEPFKGSKAWDEVMLTKDFPARETAIIVCDMWDKHWCQKASERCADLAKTMEEVLKSARARGVLIVHAPSECMEFYKDTPERRRLADVQRVKPPQPLEIAEPLLPVDASDGGCDDAKPDREHRTWTRQHATLTIGDEDGISDNGEEIYSFFKERGIKNVLMMGVHTNMCVLGRSFAIRQMTRWGMRCILVRDLTDAMYNPKKSPFVSHEAGTEMIVQHIEKYWCPTILCADLLLARKEHPQNSR